MELTNNSEYEHISISSLKMSKSHKKIKFQIVIQSYQNCTWKIKIYGLCQYRANITGIKRTGDGSRDGVDPHHLRSNIYGTGTWDGVDPPKVKTHLWF